MNKHQSIMQSMVATVVALIVLPVLHCEGQKFKLPNLLPFRKQPKQVAPMQLTDLATQQAAANGSRFDFLKGRVRMPALPGAQKGALSEFNDRSKEFFAKAGNGISKLAGDTKNALVDGWRPPRTHTAWWNKGAKDPSDRKPLFSWPSRPTAPATGALMPRPRVAREYQNKQPRHRF